MTDLPASIESWSALRQQPVPDSSADLLSKSIEVETGVGKIRVAIGRNREAKLLLPVPEYTGTPSLEESDVISISQDVFSFECLRTRYLEVTCFDTALDHVFGEVCDTIIRRINEGGAVTITCAETLAEYARLFRATKVEIPSIEVVQGLVAELLFLDSLVDREPDAIHFWLGAVRGKGRHDFRNGSVSVEVKSTGNANNSQVSISSLEQLEIPPGGLLFMRIYLLECVAGGEHSVSELCNSIEEKLSRKDVFQQKLEALGCSDYNDSAWNAFKFSLGWVRNYKVDGDFPRLTRSILESASLSSGIIDVEYTIDPLIYPESEAKNVNSKLVVGNLLKGEL